MGGVTEVLRELDEATSALLKDVDGLTEQLAQDPSLLPGWIRAHVVAHLARNAEGGARLLRSALTGEAEAEYASVAARDEDIHATAELPVAQLRDLLKEHCALLAQACSEMDDETWVRPVVWTTGQSTPAQDVPRSRLTEVLVHHVDLALDYQPSDWPTGFVTRRLDAVVASINRQRLSPRAFRLEATNSDAVLDLDGPGPSMAVRGPDHALLAWLLGRSHGTELETSDRRPLPAIPSTYTT